MAIDDPDPPTTSNTVPTSPVSRPITWCASPPTPQRDMSSLWVEAAACFLIRVHWIGRRHCLFEGGGRIGLRCSCPGRRPTGCDATDYGRSMLLAEPSRPVNLVCPVGSDLPLPASVRPVHSSGSGSAIVNHRDREGDSGKLGNWQHGKTCHLGCDAPSWPSDYYMRTLLSRD